MAGIVVTSKGDFKKTAMFLEKFKKLLGMQDIFNKYGQMGVDALIRNSPVETGLLKSSWYYQVEQKPGLLSITWSNSDIENGLNVALLVQYGHGLRDGTYLAGIDYINPSIGPLMEELADKVWKEVSKA